MKEEFKAACNNNTEYFNAIIHALQLPRRVNKQEVTRLLSYIDSIIDYYLQLDKQENACYPIIFIPCSKRWAEEVCIEYVTYKIETSSDSKRMTQLRESFGCVDAARMGLNHRELMKELAWRKIIKPIVRSVANNSTTTRNLIVCGQSIYNNLISKQRLVHLLGDSPQTSIVCFDSIEVEEKYKDYQSIENVFCFYSKNGICDTYESNAINWTGLKNCFIFEFGYASYCLHDVLKCGERLCDKFSHRPLLSREKENIYPDYITITAEEAHYLFNEKPQLSHTTIPFPEKINNDKEYIIEFYKGDDAWRFSIKDRNILSLCLSQEVQNAYIEYLRQEKPFLFEDSMWEAVFNLLLQNIKEQDVVEKIMSFVDLNRKAAFVICDTPDPIKNALKEFFNNKGLKIKFYQYKDLKDKTIKEQQIVILRFCPHNISSQYYSYKKPNSFDEFSLKDDQIVLDIINEIAIIDYSKYKYDYDLHLYSVTNSHFRKAVLGGTIEKPQNPDIQYISHYSELDEDACEQPQSNFIPTVRFDYSDGSSDSLPENEVLICEKHNGERLIENLRNLIELDQLGQIHAIQPICKLADTTMDVFFEDGRETTTAFENTLREQYVNQGYIPVNHNALVPIWKFLLERKIREYCVQNGLISENQHGELWPLLRNNLEDEHIQHLYKQMDVRVQLDTVLKNWCDLSTVEPLVPGIKKDREKLFINYLGLNKGVLSLYRKKQLLTRDITRTRNKITEGFLSRILLYDISDELATELLDDSQYAEYLAIDSKEDIETLKTIATENINLRQIKTYTI